MKTKLAVVVIFLLSFIHTEKIYAFSPPDNYLWIEYKECLKEKDGSVTLPLQINYGQFPIQKKNIPKFDSLKAFYTLDKEDNEKSRVFYETPIEKYEEKNQIKIKSAATNNFIVFVEAKITAGDVPRWYLAKTSFILFGHSFTVLSPLEKTMSCVPELEISLSPQFNYWPQTSDPVKITPLFNKDYLPRKVMYIFDENMPLINILTDEKGNYTYVPPEDKKLNWKNETAFKQAVIVTEENKENIKYISSYTLLLHRSRFKNYKLLTGSLFFLGTMITAFLIVIRKRKGFKV